MNKAQQIRIREYIIEAAEELDLDVREGYSGRGMFGSKCLGIVGSPAELHEVIVNAQAMITLDAEHGTELEPRTRIPAPRQDSMGLDIICYWPELRTE